MDIRLPWGVLLRVIAAFAGLSSGSAVFAADKILVHETFDDNRRGWLTGDEAKIENGKYRIAFLRAGTLHTSIPMAISPFSDFQIEATFREISESRPKSGYGLAWGMYGANNFHLFYIMRSGVFSYGKVADGKWAGSDWRTSSLIAKGDAENRLAVKRTGERLDYLINGSVVASGRYEPFFGSRVGFAITGGREVQIDNFVVATSETPESIAKAKAGEHFRRGRQLLGENKNAEAVEELRQAATLRPDLHAAHFLSGVALVGMQRWPEAIAQLDRALALHPSGTGYATRAEVRTSYSRALAAAGKGEAAEAELLKARDDIDMALQRDPKSAHLWLQKASIHFALFDEEEACQAAKRACKLGNCRAIEGLLCER